MGSCCCCCCMRHGKCVCAGEMQNGCCIAAVTAVIRPSVALPISQGWDGTAAAGSLSICVCHENRSLCSLCSLCGCSVVTCLLTLVRDISKSLSPPPPPPSSLKGISPLCLSVTETQRLFSCSFNSPCKSQGCFGSEYQKLFDSYLILFLISFH